ncbi:MAG: PEP-CTERM sorting domain-containing protein [Opitutales bacterium]|nr:PEP-CTERM sorting domain-containing protein [Opitutales bacterium]
MNRNTYTSLYKTLIAASVFFVFGTEIFGYGGPQASGYREPRLIYTDAAGESTTIDAPSGFFLVEENVSNVFFDSGARYVWSKDVYFNGETVRGLSVTATGAEDSAYIWNKATISGEVSISGTTAHFYQSAGGKIASGTKFSLQNNATFDFGSSATHIWNISSAETDSSFALISGTGTVTIRNTTLNGLPYTSFLQLNFENEEILKNTKTLTLADSANISTSSLGFMGLEVLVGGVSAPDYSASLDWDPNSSTFGKITITNPYIPEPSAFGLLAGTVALGFAVARRRRKA